MNNEEIIYVLKEIYVKHSNVEIAKKQKKYLLNKYDFFGIQTPLRRAITKELLKQCSEFEISKILLLCEELCLLAEREYMYFAQDLIFKVYKKLSKEDIKFIIKNLITIKGWWENCDGFIMSIYRWTEINPKYLNQIANFCLKYKNLWIRRCGLLLQLHHKTFDKKVYDKTLKANLQNQDFFIQKAIGWFLRELGKHDFEMMMHYYNSYNTQLSNVALNEIKKQIKKN